MDTVYQNYIWYLVHVSLDVMIWRRILRKIPPALEKLPPWMSVSPSP